MNERERSSTNADHSTLYVLFQSNRKKIEWRCDSPHSTTFNKDGNLFLLSFLYCPCRSQISRVRWITEIPIGLHFAFNYYNHLNCMIKSYNSYLSSKYFSKLDLKDLNMIYSFIVLFAYFRMFTLMDKSPKHLSKYLRVSILLFPTDRNFNFFDENAK